MAHDLSDYKEVKDRIAEFRTKHEHGSLQPVNPEEPYRLEVITGEDGVQHTFIVYTAAAYRSPDDERPGIGTVWEPVPGKTAFTRNSELMNAETSAWGRAIIAALASDASTSVASQEEVRNRAAERDTQAASKAAAPQDEPKASEAQVKCIFAVARNIGWTTDKLMESLAAKYGEDTHPADLTKAQAKHVIDGLKKVEEQQKAEK